MREATDQHVERLVAEGADAISDAVHTVTDGRQKEVLSNIELFKANVKIQVNVTFDQFWTSSSRRPLPESPKKAAVVGVTETMKSMESAVSDIKGTNGETVTKDYLITSRCLRLALSRHLISPTNRGGRYSAEKSPRRLQVDLHAGKARRVAG